MQPKRLSFTEVESKALGDYLDKFVAAGPLEALPEDRFRDVQVLIARKIWEIRPDLARAIQAVADKDETPALLIENVPIDDPLPITPNFVRLISENSLPPLRSHYFNAGIALIRYGEIIPKSAVTLLHVVNEPESIRMGTVTGRPMHRDAFKTTLGDIALHVQRENQEAATPLISIDDIPIALLERLKKAQFTYNDSATPIIQEHGDGWRFHPHFICDRDIGGVDDRQAATEFFAWMKSQAQEQPLILRNKDFLLIDQSRVFHGAMGHDVIFPHEKDRWLTHMRCEVTDGIHHALQDKTPYYTIPEYIDEAAILHELGATKIAKSTSVMHP